MRLLLPALFCFSYFILPAQEKKLVQHIGWKGNHVELHTISNQHQSCSFLLSKDSIKAFLLTGNSEVFELYTIPRRSEEKFLGGFFKNGHICLFMDNGQKAGLHSWLYNINSKQVTENIVPFEIKNEKIIQRLSSNSYFFYFTMSKKTPEFVIYKFNNELQPDTLRYTVSPALLTALKVKNKQLFGSSAINIEKTDMEGECDIDIAQCPNKIYIRNDTMYLLINNQNAVTAIYSFDLKTDDLTERLINHNQHSDYAKADVFNSFLSRDKLYYASASMNGILLQVVDFYSGNVLKEFKATGDEEIAFKNTAIIQEGGAFGGTRELGKTNQLLRKMTGGNLVITATRDDRSNKTELLIGSYKQVSSGGGGGGMWMGGGAVAGGISPMIYVPTGGFTRNSWAKSARFKMLIDDRTNEHVDGTIPLSINDRIESYTKGIPIPSEAENLFVINGNYFYAFYNKEERDFIVIQF